MIRLTHDPIDYHALTESVRRADCGAVVLFLGTVRDLTDGKVTVALDYEAYPGMAEKKMAEIEADTRGRWAVGDLAMIHRLGRLDVGEVSVTDRCNLRCTYCMPEEVVFMDRSELLTFEEITHFVRVAAPLGIDKVRLTGGEPLMRKNLDRLVGMVVAVPGIKDVGLTTNGLL